MLRVRGRACEHFVPPVAQGGPGCFLVTQHRRYASLVQVTCLMSWSGWGDLNSRPLRPEPRKRSNNRPDEKYTRWLEHCAQSN
jgi:hypothetical protein